MIMPFLVVILAIHSESPLEIGRSAELCSRRSLVRSVEDLRTNRRAVVRTPERALQPAPKLLAYLTCRMVMELQQASCGLLWSTGFSLRMAPQLDGNPQGVSELKQHRFNHFSAESAPVTERLAYFCSFNAERYGAMQEILILLLPKRSVVWV